MSIFDLFRKNKNADAASMVSALSKNEIVMDVDSDSIAIAPHASKLGGNPFLPVDFTWPVFADGTVTRPLSFLCQINLAEVAEYDRDGLLPGKGMLYFFYECEAFRWGFDPKDKGSAQVFYFENTAGFQPLSWPEEIPEEYVVPEMAVRFTPRPSYPNYEELDLHSSTDCQWEEYDAILEKMGVDLDAETHKLLGYADIIQSEMLTECERVTRGLYCGNPESYQAVSRDAEESIAESAKDWILLLQLTTLETDDWQWMWGDCGMLYFYIKKQDLAAKRFENAWFSLQCG